jgi:hypothetical protein
MLAGRRTLLLLRSHSKNPFNARTPLVSMRGQVSWSAWGNRVGWRCLLAPVLVSYRESPRVVARGRCAHL